MVRQAFIELGVTGLIPEDLLEMKTNLARVGKIWKRQWRAEGWAEGKAEGKLEGKIEGKIEGKVAGKLERQAEVLVWLLAERFGTVTPSLSERISGANLATLECWFKRAIAAPDLLSVFAQPLESELMPPPAS